MTAGAALAVGIGLLVRRWAWTDRHALLLAGGALVGHTLIGITGGRERELWLQP